jgi:glutathione synthase/RimK-type ligase-like ATP-grasp enzyme
MKKVIGIYRESVLAGKPSSDQRIMDLTLQELQNRGFEVKSVKVEDFDTREDVQMILTMARGEEINKILSSKKEEGVLILNDPLAIRFSFNRKGTCERLIELNANVPSTKYVMLADLSMADITKKSILKPANRHEFWFVVENEEELGIAKDAYSKEGISEVIVQDFVVGDSVKYYCIDEEVLLPADIGVTYPNELIDQIRSQAVLSGRAIGLKIFGGDFIVSTETAYCLDTNDWPSFGSVNGITQEESASKIADFAENEYSKKYVHE